MSNSSKSNTKNSDGYNPCDVIVGKGNHSKNAGNQLCSRLINQSLDSFYAPVATPQDQQLLLLTIYEAIGASGGRFITSSPKATTVEGETAAAAVAAEGTVLEMSQDEALDKIKRMFVYQKGLMARKKAKEREATNDNAAAVGVNFYSSTDNDISYAAVAVATAGTNDPPGIVPVNDVIMKDGDYPQTARKQAAVAAASNKVIVTRNRILKGSMTEDHALMLIKDIAFPTQGDRLEAADMLLKQLQIEKNDIKAYSKKCIIDVMVQTAQQVGLGTGKQQQRAVKRYEDISDCWVQDSSMDNQQKLHAVLYGIFQNPNNKRGFSPRLLQAEQDYLRLKGWMYPPPPPPSSSATATGTPTTNTGYIYEVMYLQLNHLQQRVKQRGEKRHGIWMTPTNERFEQGPDKKRIKVHDDGSSVVPTVASAASAASATSATSATTKGNGKNTAKVANGSGTVAVVVKSGIKKAPISTTTKTDKVVSTKKISAPVTATQQQQQESSEMAAPPRTTLTMRTTGGSDDDDDFTTNKVTPLAGGGVTATATVTASSETDYSAQADAATEKLLAPAPDDDTKSIRSVAVALVEESLLRVRGSISSLNGKNTLVLPHLGITAGILMTIVGIHQILPAVHVVSAF